MARKALSEAEIQADLVKLSGWQHSGDALVKVMRFETYWAGVDFAVKVAHEAERLDHHPDIVIGYKQVRVSFTTHDAGHQVSRADVRAAEAVDALESA